MEDDNSSNYYDSSSDLEDLQQHMFVCMEIYEHWRSNIERTPCNTSSLTGPEYVKELLNGHTDRIYDSFRMDKHVFLRLCTTLEHFQLLEHDRLVGIHESVAIFLFIVSHSIRVRVAAECFQCSKETIHRQFKCVLKAVCGLAPRIIRAKI